MPKAKPVSLHPLTFEDAIKALIQEKVSIKKHISKHKPSQQKSKVKKS